CRALHDFNPSTRSHARSRSRQLISFSLGREKVLAAGKPVHCGRIAQLMISALRFPTVLHCEVAELAGDFFSAHASVDTILVVNSCARGRTVAGSDLAVAVLMMPRSPRPGVILL